VCVTWPDARAYARWLSHRTGKRYRFPAEAEWECAARAGTETAYPWGIEASHGQANYGSDKCCLGLPEGKDQWVATSPVGAFAPNAFGPHDMNGNVMQWVQDCLSDYAELGASRTAYEDPRPLKNSDFLLRGMAGAN
jgi:formylglycine-generating enzyme required for sulfatase activity